MQTYSVWHWAIVIILALVFLIPYWKIFQRAGWFGPLSILMVVPVVNIVLLWVLAFKRWPRD